ncbi:MAG: hypothetical protein JO013_07065 [Alphaproteobacteria bacterium]|nr:hypothetical protein [Alphaproteobacteria bacterium]
MVTGVRHSYDRALTDVRTITADNNGHYARFESEICPLVLGLSRQLAAPVEARIRSVASRVGLRTAGTSCAANVTIIIADDGPAVILALRRKMPELFTGLSGFEIGRLKRESGPVWNWYSIDPKRRDGAPVEHISQIAFGPSDPPKPVSPHAYIASNVTLSRLTEPVRLDLALSFVVINSRAAAGLTLQQLADASAVLGLSMINPRRVGELRSESVLQVLSTSGDVRRRIAGATDFDIRYLSALYSGDSGYSSDQQAARLATAIERSNARLARPAEN